MGFYERYSEACLLRGIKPHSKKIADLFGIDSSLPSKWKKSGITPEAETVRTIADALDVSTDYLLERTDDPRDFSDPDLIAELSGPVLDHFNGDVGKALKYQKAVAQDVKNEKPLILTLYEKLNAQDKGRLEQFAKIMLDSYPKKESKEKATAS